MKHLDYNAPILVSQSTYDIKNDKRFLIPFVQGFKIGFVNKDAEIVIPASYDFVLDVFYCENSLVRVGNTFGIAYQRKNSEPSVYLHKRFGLLKSNGDLLLPIEYEGISMPIFSDCIVLRSNKLGYAVIDSTGNFVVPFGKYNYIDGYDNGYARVKLGKNTNGLRETDALWGIIDENGKEVLKPIYKNIGIFYDKTLLYTRVESENGIFEFHLSEGELKYYGYQRDKDAELEKELNDYESLKNYRESTYKEYNGSYAQDVMGVSDQDINDALDGDPEAYWNID